MLISRDIKRNSHGILFQEIYYLENYLAYWQNLLPYSKWN